MFFFFSGSGAAPDPRLLPLSAIVSGCVFDLDATLAASYDGTSQLWKNLVPAPADGAAQAAYDFTLGATASASTDDPTFNGTAGSPAAYFSFDGGDFFQLANNNTTFINSLHRTDVTQPFTFGYLVRNPPSGDVFGMATNIRFDHTAQNRGVSLSHNVPNNLAYSVFAGDTVSLLNSYPGSGAANTDSYVIFSYSPATNSLRRWINTRTKSTSTLTKNTCVTDASQRINLGRRGASVFNAFGTRIYSSFMTNTFIDDAEVALILDQLELRHERTY